MRSVVTWIASWEVGLVNTSCDFAFAPVSQSSILGFNLNVVLTRLHIRDMADYFAAANAALENLLDLAHCMPGVVLGLEMADEQTYAIFGIARWMDLRHCHTDDSCVWLLFRLR